MRGIFGLVERLLSFHLVCSLELVVIDVTVAAAATAVTTTATIASSVNDDRKLISFFHICIPFTCLSLSFPSFSSSVFFFPSYRNSSPRILATTEDIVRVFPVF